MVYAHIAKTMSREMNVQKFFFYQPCSSIRRLPKQSSRGSTRKHSMRHVRAQSSAEQKHHGSLARERDINLPHLWPHVPHENKFSHRTKLTLVCRDPRTPQYVHSHVAPSCAISLGILIFVASRKSKRPTRRGRTLRTSPNAMTAHDA